MLTDSKEGGTVENKTKMKHANYARTRATTAKGGQTTFNSVGPDRATEFRKPIKTEVV